MPVLLVGLNHRTAPVELREQLALTGCGLRMALETLNSRLIASSPSSSLYEGVILSTCNRLEIYVLAPEAQNGWRQVERFLAELQGIPVDTLHPHLYHHAGENAVTHLMRVAAGLDSMILGEPQILGQVSSAYDAARSARTAGPVLSHLLAQAIHAGKRARTETAISRHTTSISHAAAELARATCGDLGDVNALVVGAGEMAKLAAQALQRYGCTQITFINRTLARAQGLAEEMEADALNWYHLPEALTRADLVITATGAPHTVIHAEDTTRILPQREDRPLTFIDIAVPRDVEEATGDLDRVTRYDIDDLQSTVDANIAERRAAIPAVEAILAEETCNFATWLDSRDVAPVIAELRRKAAELAATEVTQALNKLEALDDHDQQVIERLAHRIVNKLLHEPTIRLKAHAASGDGSAYAEVMRELFALQAEGERRPTLPTSAPARPADMHHTIATVGGASYD